MLNSVSKGFYNRIYQLLTETHPLVKFQSPSLTIPWILRLCFFGPATKLRFSVPVSRNFCLRPVTLIFLFFSPNFQSKLNWSRMSWFLVNINYFGAITNFQTVLERFLSKYIWKLKAWKINHSPNSHFAPPHFALEPHFAPGFQILKLLKRSLEFRK